MRILVVSPYMPPAPGGVSDHSARLVRELTARGCEIEVVTFTRAAQLPNELKMHWIHDRASRKEFETALRAFSPECILIAFTPLSFAPNLYGIGPVWPLRFRRWAGIARAPLFFYAHESHYPVKLTAKGLLIGIPHFLQFCALAQAARAVIFSHWAACRFWRRVLPRRRSSFAVLPVFSNIEPNGATQDIRVRLALPPHSRLALYFGGAHDMNLLDFVLAAFASLRANGGEDFRLVLAGVSSEDAARRLGGPLPEGAIATGYLSAADISALYRECALVLAPFGEGINSRRGSAMAAFAHGKPLVTTRGWCTANDIPWSDFARLAENREDFVAATTALAENREEAARLGQAGKKYYESNFSPPVISGKLLELLRSRTAP